MCQQRLIAVLCVVIGFAALVSSAAADEPAAGLAARYAGDKGIENDPAVLLAEDFEHDSIEKLAKRWDDVSNKDDKALAFSDERPEHSTGKHSLQVTATRGENTGGHLYKMLPRGVDRVYVRFYVKFADDADYTHHFFHFGGHRPPLRWPNPKAGLRPEGDDRFSVGIEPAGRWGRHPAPGVWNFYTYWQDMKASADGKHWGNSLHPATPAPVPRNRWQCVEAMLKLNSQPELHDGELTLWLDGDLQANFAPGARRGKWSGMGFDLVETGGEPFEGFRWRSRDDLKINYVWLLHYVTDGAARQNRVANPRPINRVWFDDLVVATEYIGPLRPRAAGE